MIHSDVLIIGSGPAGYSAAIYAARAGLKTVIVSGSDAGGQLMWTTDVENYPGFRKPIQGPFLMQEMLEQSKACGAEFIEDTITKVDFSKRPFDCFGKKYTYTSQTVIIATGARAKWLDVEGEENYKGFGVSACAVCDGFFFKNQIVAVVGGGNTAVEDALFLSRHAQKVYLIHRRDQLRAEKILQKRLFEHEKIEVIWNYVVEKVVGQDQPKKVTALYLSNTLTNEKRELKVGGVFVAIGHHPNTEIFEQWLPLTNSGYIDVPLDRSATKIPGVFVAGDVRDFIYRQAVTAAGQGCMAALDAEKFLTLQE